MDLIKSFFRSSLWGPTSYIVLKNEPRGEILLHYVCSWENKKKTFNKPSGVVYMISMYNYEKSWKNLDFRTNIV